MSDTPDFANPDELETWTTFKKEYKRVVEWYARDHAKACELEELLASETRWSNEYHLEVERLQREQKWCDHELLKLDALLLAGRVDHALDCLYDILVRRGILKEDEE